MLGSGWMGPDVAGILRMLEWSHATGTLTLAAGEIDLADGKPVAAWASGTTGRSALATLRAADASGFTFTSRAARPANLEPDPEPHGVRASLSQLRSRTIPLLDQVSRDQLLRRGLFTTKAPTLLDEPPAAANVWKPVELASLANALISEYAGATYGGRLWNDDVATRFGATGAPLATPIRVDAGRIDAPSLRERKDLDELVPFLRGLLRAIFMEALKSVGEGAARRGYRAAVTRLWGAQERVVSAAQRVVDERPPQPARLVIKTEEWDGEFALRDREYVIGRASTSEIQLAHASVSRTHARITPRAGAHAISDSGSTSGTLVNGAKLAGEQPLRDGDVIKIGALELVYEGV
jgi:FHA domain-containing protein